MNQINILSLLYANSGLTSVDAQAGNAKVLDSLPVDHLEFLVHLRQEIWSSRMLRAADETQTAEPSHRFTAAVLGSLAGAGEAGATEAIMAADITATGHLPDGGPPVLEPSVLLAALLDSLRAILDGELAAVTGEAPGDGKVVASRGRFENTISASPGAPAVLADWQPADAQQTTPGPVFPASLGQIPVDAGSTSASAAAQRLLLAWPQIMALLQSGLIGETGPVQVATSTPAYSENTGISMLTPWSLIIQDGQAMQAGNPQYQGLLNSRAALPDDLAGAPASIRWFAGDNAKVANGMTAETPGILVEELTLPDGTRLLVSLAETAAPPETGGNPRTGQAYNVRLDFMGSEAASIQAKLTVTRLENPVVLPTAVDPRLGQTDPAVAAKALPVGEPASPGGLPATSAIKPDQSLVIPQANQVLQRGSPDIVQGSLFAPPQSIQADQSSGGLRPVPAASPFFSQAPSEVIGGQPAQAAAQPGAAVQPDHGGFQPVTPPQQDAAVTQAQVLRNPVPAVTPALDAVGFEGAQQAQHPTLTAVKSAPVLAAVQANSQAAGTGFVETVAAPQAAIQDQVLEQLFDARSPLAADGRLSELPEVSRTAQLGLSPLAELAPNGDLAVPGNELAAPYIPSQLLQFSESSFITRPYAGLDYLEMSEQLMQRVANARSAGDGLYAARLDLNPPNLGRMYVNISVRGETVALQMAVASGVPKEQLKDSLESLRRSLEEEGMNVVELRIVELDPDAQRSGNQQYGRDENQDDGNELENHPKETPSVPFSLKGLPILD